MASVGRFLPRQDVHPGAQGGNAKKFQVALIFSRALAKQVFDVEMVSHAKCLNSQLKIRAEPLRYPIAPRKKISVY